MAGEAAPSDYYPNQGSFAERYMRTRDGDRYPNEGSGAYNGAGGDVTPPAAPSGFGATPGNAEATLTWTDPVDADLVSVRVYRDAVLVATVAAGTETYVDTGLTNSTLYSYHLTAIDAVPNESASSGAVQVTPRAMVRYDTFTDTDETAIASHTPDIGTGVGAGAWSAPVNAVRILNNRADPTVSNQKGTVIWDSGVDYIDIECDLVYGGNNDQGLYLRWLDNSNFVGCQLAASTLQVFEKVGGVQTNYGFGIPPAADGGGRVRLGARISGALIQLYAPDTGLPIVEVSKTSFDTGNTGHGFFTKDNADNFYAYEFVDENLTATPSYTFTSTTEPVSGKTRDLYVPTGVTTSTPDVPLVIHFHGIAGGTLAESRIESVRDALINSGHIVIGGGTGAHWGNEAARDYYYALYTYVTGLGYDISDVLFLGESMGGLSSLLMYDDGRIPNVRAWAGISPACDLASAYATPSLSGGVESAYDFSGSGEYAAATAGADPVLLPASTWDGLAMRFYSADGDSTTPRADHTQNLIAAVGTSPVEAVDVPCGGSHLANAAYFPRDLLTFFNRSRGL